MKTTQGKYRIAGQEGHRISGIVNHIVYNRIMAEIERQERWELCNIPVGRVLTQMAMQCLPACAGEEEMPPGPFHPPSGMAADKPPARITAPRTKVKPKRRGRRPKTVREALEEAGPRKVRSDAA